MTYNVDKPTSSFVPVSEIFADTQNCLHELEFRQAPKLLNGQTHVCVIMTKYK